MTHTRTPYDRGPDYCAECSKAAQAWVRWPCDATDITANRHGGNEHSTAAHASLTDKAKIRAAILTFIASRGELGATSDEAEQALGLSHQTVSARFTELKANGSLTPAGRRPTRSGRSAGVYVAVPVQGELWSA